MTDRIFLGLRKIVGVQLVFFTTHIHKQNKMATNKIVKKTQREHVLDRPDTYIGTVRYAEVERLVAEDYDADVVITSAPAEGDGVAEVEEDAVTRKETRTRIVEKRIQFCPGLTQLFMEILNNARDRTVVTDVEVRCNRIEVGYDAASGSIWVQNNGDGVSIEMHPTYGVYNPELIFGHLLTSTNYDDSERRIVGGRNGFGAKLTNIYSSRFTIETVDARTKRKYVQTWTNNMSSVGTAVVTEGVKSRPYTKITWTFDHPRFGKTNVLDADFISVMHKAVVDIAATVGTKVTVFFQGREITCDTLAKYTDLFPPLSGSPKLHVNVNDRWKVAVATVHPDVGGRCVSFVNGMWTSQGGTHESLVLNQVVEAIANAIRSRAKGADKALVDKCLSLNRIIKNYLWVFVDACIENPEFASQTKECLKSPVREFGSTCELPPAFIRKIGGLDVADQILDQLRGKSQASMKNTDGRKVSNISGIPKLDDAPLAGTRRSNECVLIVTEGDSAKATAIAGLAARRDRDRFGVFALRGKIRNVTDAPAADLSKTEGEFYYLKKILGLQQGKTYETEADLKTLRYGKLVVFTDQDTDGFHIKALVMNIFARFWPVLLRTGFVQSLPTPLIKATKGKQCLPFYSMPAFRTWALSADTNGWKIKYYKGLGTSTKEDALEYFKGFQVTEYVERPRATLHSFFGASNSAGAGAPSVPPLVEETTDLFLNLFSKDRTDYRKTWVQAFNPEATIDNSRREITLAEFLHTEYRQHADDNLRRTTPSVVDGLKPSQRKILFGCFRKGLDVGSAEMKVAQLGAAVAEITSYHHGEVSLMSSITKMAQTFVGSNNINLLEPLGQFGTRLEGGDDAASPRYIFTRISSLAKLVFRKEDNPILEYLEDEGNSIEPVEYLPVIPMVLVNGADGIGTGYSTKVPPSNPLEVIANVRAIIQAGGVVPDHVSYMPWWSKFTGSVVQESAEKYSVRGVYTASGGSVHITELPVGVWSSPYKTYLEELVSENKIAGFEWPVDDERVDIRVELVQAVQELTGIDAVEQALEFEANPAAAAKAAKRKAPAAPSSTDEIEKLFKLVGKASTSNVHLYTSGKTSHIRKYTIRDIYVDFYTARMAGYEKRKQFILAGMEHDHRVARAKITFIEAKLSGRLVLENRADSDVQSDLAALGLPLAHELGLKSSSGYDYLLDMKLRSLTRAKVDALRADVIDLERNIGRVRATPVEHTWLNELLELECKIRGVPFVANEFVGGATNSSSSSMEVDESNTASSSSLAAGEEEEEVVTAPVRKRRGVAK
jgi:DNA topoisomerase-2